METGAQRPGVLLHRVCAVCGEAIRPGRMPGTYTHVARLVASCDLDGDHPAVPVEDPPAR